MKTIRRYALGLAVALLAAASLEAQETVRLSGGDVAIYNLAGTARIVAGSGSDVVVRVATQGPDRGRLELATGRVGGRETLRVIYPGDRIVYPELGRGSQTNLRVRDDGTFGDGRGRGGERVEIRGSGRGLEAWADLVVEVPAGQRVAVFVAAGEAEARGVRGNLTIDTGSGAVTAADIAGSLSVDTGSGSVEVDGMDGDLGVDTGSGSVRLRDVRGGDVMVDTGSGSVTGVGIRAATVEIDTGSGRIELDQVESSDIVLDTGSGSVELELLSDVDRLVIDTGSGSVTVRAPASLGAEIELDTGSGGIDLDLPVQVRTVRRDFVTGVVGDGRGRIRIDTGSGSIRLLRN